MRTPTGRAVAIAVILSASALGSVLAVSARAQTTRPAADAVTETYKVDPVHTAIIFRIKHFGVSYFYGRFNDTSGTVAFNPADPEACSFELKTPVTGIDTANDKRNQDLLSAGMFNAAEYPEIAFKSTKVRNMSGDRYAATGDLTLHGETRQMTIKIDLVGMGPDPWGGYRAGFETTFTIKRSDFGMDFMPGGLGDEVTIMAGVECVRE